MKTYAIVQPIQWAGGTLEAGSHLELADVPAETIESWLAHNMIVEDEPAPTEE